LPAHAACKLRLAPLVQLDAATTVAEYEAVGQCVVVLKDILANHIATAIEPKVKISVAKMRAVAHQVPRNRAEHAIERRRRRVI
jgi:hypothetical protein